MAATPTDNSAATRFKRRFLTRLTAVLVGGMFLDGYILGIIGTVIGAISAELKFSPLWEGLIVASSLLGILVGSPVGGWLGDKFGRKPLSMIDMGIFFVGSVLQFFVHEPWQLFLVRLLMGIAVGVEYSVGWPLMSEFALARMRGQKSKLPKHRRPGGQGLPSPPSLRRLLPSLPLSWRTRSMRPCAPPSLPGNWQAGPRCGSGTWPRWWAPT
jgi:hypothetical protein